MRLVLDGIARWGPDFSPAAPVRGAAAGRKLGGAMAGSGVTGKADKAAASLAALPPPSPAWCVESDMFAKNQQKNKSSLTRFICKKNVYFVYKKAT